MNQQEEQAPTLRQATLLRLFMDALSERVQRHFSPSLLMAFALFAYALMAPADWRLMGMRLIGAALFTALVHVRWRRETEGPK